MKKGAKKKYKSSLGFTFVEMVLSITILCILALVLGNLTLQSSKIARDADQRYKTDVALRTAMEKVETTILNANYFELVRTTEVIFRADRNTDPNYLSSADDDSDGFLNISDPDDDNDATLIKPSTAQWQIGYDIKDDDEDSDNAVDIKWRVRFSTALKTLYRDYSRNGEAWGNHEETLLTHVVSTPIFTFYGSKDTLLCATCGSTDTNSDGIITSSEIDAAANGGNGNSLIDTSTETNKIVSLGIYLDQDDEDPDTEFDSHLSVEIMPPPLYLKRRP